MIVSGNEVHGVIRKAALGASVPPGTADDLANAVAWMANYGLSALRLALDHIESGDAANLNYATAFDRLLVGETTVRVAKASNLLMGFAAMASRDYGTSFTITWLNRCAIVSDQGFTVTGAHAEGDAIISTSDRPPDTSKIAEIVIDDQSWADANRLAAAFYVPATEASRLGGAGAGVNDND